MIWALLACTNATDPAPAPDGAVSGNPAFTLVYSGAVDGEIEPCG